MIIASCDKCKSSEEYITEEEYRKSGCSSIDNYVVCLSCRLNLIENKLGIKNTK